MPNIIDIIAAWLIADFLSGLAHWFEDRMMPGPSRYKLLNRIIEDNRQHHARPGRLVVNSIWENMDTSAVFTLPSAGFLWIIGAPAFVWLAIFFVSFGNVVHRFAHTPPSQRNIAIDFLQYLGIFQAPEHHRRHHYGPTSIKSREEASDRYCVMSDYLNPALDKIRFWRIMERLLGRE